MNNLPLKNSMNLIIINNTVSTYPVIIVERFFTSGVLVGKGEIWMESKIEVLSTVKIQYSSDLYKIVDALNRTLKQKDLMFGLALDQDDKNKAIFTIYRT